MIRVKNLHLEFPGLKIFSGLNFEVKPGEKVAITGESGRGKTTLLHTLMGFIPDFQGEIYIMDYPLRQDTVHVIRQKTGYVPQELNFGIFSTARELFEAPFQFKANVQNKPGREETENLFKKFNLPAGILNKTLKEISGGQKQRLALASVILLRKPLMLLDEPTSALDQENKKEVINYLFSMKNTTILASTHDPEWIKHCDKIINLDKL